MAYAKINTDGQLTYATMANGGLVVDGKVVYGDDAAYAALGYYPVKNVMEDGTPKVEDGVILNYIGAPASKSELQTKIDSINGQLADTDPLIKALERLIAAEGVNEEDKKMAADRIALRDELGKVVQTETGDGTAMNPYRWNEGDEVVVDMWYKTPSGYIWQAIKSGVPASETDSEYFDVVGL